MAKMPILRPFLFLVVGILLAYYLALPIIIVIILFFTLSLCLLLLLRYKKSAIEFRYRWLYGLPLGMLFLGLGALACYCKEVQNSDRWYGHYKDSQQYVAVVSELPNIRAKTIRVLINMSQLTVGSEIKNVVGKCFAYLPISTTNEKLQVGDTLFFAKPIIPIRGMGNPGGFDFGQYCARQQIYGQVFLREGEYAVHNFCTGFSLPRIIARCQLWTIQTLQKYIPGKVESGFAEALLIGYKNDLDKEVVNAYTSTGVVHIIAISGGHLAVLYALLSGLFNRMTSLRWGKYFTFFFIVSLVWFFTLLTGFSASIVRAAIMITIMLMGKTWSKRPNTLNSLVVSGFVMLVINPLWLWDAGFWLSFTAVLGIVLCQVPLLNIFKINNLLLRKLWQMTALTLSAQVFTWPIILYLFHQFPIWFLVANCVVIPLSSCVLIGELCLLAVSVVPPIGYFVGFALKWLIFGMNKYIIRLWQLPISPIIIGIDFWQMLLCFFLVFAVLYGCSNGWRKTWRYIVALMIAIVVISIGYAIQSSQRERLIVYNISKHSYAEVVQGSKIQYMGENISEDESLYLSNILPTRIFFHLPMTALLPAWKNELIQVGGRKIFFYKNNASERRIFTDSVDIVILDRSLPKHVDSLRQYMHFSTIVLDSSVPMWKIEKWKKECSALPLRFHSVSESGAFIVE